MEYLEIKNWEKFQHYKDDRPIKWIKLYLSLLRDYDFNALTEVQQNHLWKIWLLAAELNNKVPNDPEYISKQICAKSKVDINQLVESGFLIPRTVSYDTVRNSTAYTYVELEKEIEIEIEKEKERDVSPGLFPSPRPTAPQSDKIVLSFKCKKNGEYFDLTKEKLNEFQVTYPHIDCFEEFRRAKLWLENTPDRRKTKRGMPSFLTNWINRAKTPAPRKYADESDDGERQEGPYQLAKRILPENLYEGLSIDIIEHGFVLHNNDPFAQEQIESNFEEKLKDAFSEIMESPVLEWR